MNILRILEKSHAVFIFKHLRSKYSLLRINNKCGNNKRHFNKIYYLSYTKRSDKNISPCMT